MPRQNRSIEGLIGGHCKIRKRGCSSSSSSSSIVQNYRFKRAILVGKRGGSSTPVPTWKLRSRSSSVVPGTEQSPKYPPPSQGGGGGGKGKQPPISARKLAATLWEMNEIPSPRMKDDVLEERRVLFKKEMRGVKDRNNSRSVQSGSLPPHLSDPSHSPVSERMDRSGTGNLRRRSSAISQKLRPTDHNVGCLDSLSNNASLMEMETRSRGITPTGSVLGTKNRLKDLSNGLTTSKELLKILNRIWGLEEQHSSGMSLVSALRVELDRARMQVEQLIQEQRSGGNEINYLMKRFAEEKAAWKSKEQEKIQAAIDSIAEDLDMERKLRRRAESLNKKLGRELAETNTSLSKVMKELDSEKRIREVMEEACEALARSIGEDKAEVEELKRESAKVLEEVEKEREMLQFADVLREERVQMKLSEAKFQFEEKNAAVDKLRNELETILKFKKAKENQVLGSNVGNSRLVSYPYQNEEGDDDGEVVEDGEEREAEDDEDSAAESDLHSIELNMDNTSKGCKWSYAAGATTTREDPKRVSVEEMMINKGRKSISEKMPRGGGILWKLRSENGQNSGDGVVDWDRFSELERQTSRDDYEEDETQRYKSVKGIRDQLLSGSRMASARGFASPTRQWGQPWPSRDTTNAAGRDKPRV